jgi:nucleoporin NUP2
VDHTKVLEAGSVHDQEGEGEEDEETIHDVKTKVYTLNKEEGAWKDLGLGMLKVKKHKETGARRLLLRNSSTGKVTIVSEHTQLHLHTYVERSRLLQNFRLYAGMKPSVTKQVVSLIGHDDKGNGVPFRLRVKTEKAAQELKDVLDKEAPS